MQSDLHQSPTEIVMYSLGHNIRRKPPNFINVLQMSVQSGNKQNSDGDE